MRHLIKAVKKEGAEKYADSLEVEMADVIIRVLDFCASKGIDIDQYIKIKMNHNSLRPYKHGKKY